MDTLNNKHDSGPSHAVLSEMNIPWPAFRALENTHQQDYVLSLQLSVRRDYGELQMQKKMLLVHVLLLLVDCAVKLGKNSVSYVACSWHQVPKMRLIKTF
jgi:hypothetical protein